MYTGLKRLLPVSLILGLLMTACVGSVGGPETGAEGGAPV